MSEFGDINLDKRESYLGNTNIKKTGVNVSWTPEMKDEFIKCANDPIYFSEKYIKIVSVDEGFIPIKLYDFQKEIIKNTHENRRVSVVASRQLGKTTVATCIILHYIIFNEFKNVALLANKAAGAREILSRIQLAYEALPKWLQHGVVVWNKGSIELENGCKVFASASSADSIRGTSIALLYVDECAFVKNWSDFMASTYPTISSAKESKLLLTSTPNGMNHFYDICRLARLGESHPDWNGFHFIEAPWHAIPTRDEEWRKDTLASINFDEERFAQEYECSFLGSAKNLISSVALKLLVDKVPEKKGEFIKQYKAPVRGRSYFLSVDVSRGKGLDYSTISVFDITEAPYDQVCTYRNNEIGPVDFSSIVHNIANMYNEAYVLIEINDIGGQVADIMLLDYGYGNMMFSETQGGRKILSSGFGSSASPGVRTTSATKRNGCTTLKSLVEMGNLIINDKETIAELRTFVRSGDSYAADVGKHDDMAMTLVLFAWAVDQKYFKEISDFDVEKLFREKSEDEWSDELMPFGLLSDRGDGSDHHVPNFLQNDVW